MFCLYTFPLARPAQAKIQKLTAICCIVNLSHLYMSAKMCGGGGNISPAPLAPPALRVILLEETGEAIIVFIMFFLPVLSKLFYLDFLFFSKSCPIFLTK